jgi:hypothetical protein
LQETKAACEVSHIRELRKHGGVAVVNEKSVKGGRDEMYGWEREGEGVIPIMDMW